MTDEMRNMYRALLKRQELVKSALESALESGEIETVEKLHGRLAELEVIIDYIKK